MTVRVLVLAAAGSILASGAHALDCGITMDSMIASAKVAYEETISITVGPNIPPQVSHVIWDTKQAFIEHHGKWTKSPMTMQALFDQYNQIKKEAKMTCQELADEPMGGETAAVYTAHVVYMDTTQNNKLWISKATRLPLKSVDDQGAGTVITTTWSYKNITPPAGVQ